MRHVIQTLLGLLTMGAIGAAIVGVCSACVWIEEHVGLEQLIATLGGLALICWIAHAVGGVYFE